MLIVWAQLIICLGFRLQSQIPKGHKPCNLGNDCHHGARDFVRPDMSPQASTAIVTTEELLHQSILRFDSKHFCSSLGG